MLSIFPPIPARFIKTLRIAVILGVLYYISLFNYDQYVFKYTVQVACLLSALFICGVREQSLNSWVRPIYSDVIANKYQYFWLFSGLVIIGAVLFILELKQPYYFSQDDSHFLFIPTIIQAMRGFFHEGIFPTWNGYLLMSGPTTTTGWYALTYPITYLSYAVATYLLRQEFHVLEVSSWIHIMSGYVLSYLVFRTLRISSPLSVAASICFVLLGYNLIMGRAGNQYLPSVMWFPALMLSIVILTKRRISFHWVMATAFVIAMYFHSGSIQLWFYGMMFWGIGIIWVMGCKQLYDKQQCTRLFMTVLIGGALCSPLLIAQFLETKGIIRGQFDMNIGIGLSNFLLPWPLAVSPNPFGDMVNPGTTYFSGAIFIICFFLRFSLEAAYLAKCRLDRNHLANIIFSMLACLAFVLAMGSQAKLWNLLSNYPPFIYFRIPYKILPFLIFFMTASGVLFAETFRKKIKFGNFLSVILAIAAISLASWNALNCKSSLFFFADRPYPLLPPSYTRFQAIDFSTNKRIAAYFPERSGKSGFPITLGKNYATYYQIPVTWGQNFDTIDMNLAENRNAVHFADIDRENFYKEFAVEWITISKLQGERRPWSDTDIENLRTKANQVLDLGVIEAFNIATPETKHMAYIESSPQMPLPYKIRTDGVDIDIQNAVHSDGKYAVIANFLHRHWFSAYTDMERDVPVRADGMGRIAVELSKSAKILSIRYSPPWHYGFLLGAELLALAWLLSKFNASTGRSNCNHQEVEY